MNLTDNISIYNYDFDDQRFINESEEEYQIDYLLGLIDEANDWNEEILEGYTAAEALICIVYNLGLETGRTEMLDDIFEAVGKAVEVERNS